MQKTNESMWRWDCELLDIQKFEIENVMRNIGEELSVFETMTPTNFDWIYNECQKVLDSINKSIDEISICFLLSLTVPLEDYNKKSSFFSSLFNIIWTEYKKSPEIHNRLSNVSSFIPKLNFRDLRYRAQDFYFDMAMLPDDEFVSERVFKRQLELMFAEKKKTDPDAIIDIDAACHEYWKHAANCHDEKLKREKRN